MYCQKCGTQNSEDASFCSSCGAPLAAPVSQPTPPPTAPSYNPQTMTPPPSSHKDPIIAAVLCFIFGVGYLYLGYRKVLGLPTIFFVIITLIAYIILGAFTFGLLELVLAIFLAYDGYVKAKGQRGYLGTEPGYIYGNPPH